MTEDLFTLVSRAQKGDSKSLAKILEIFSPLLNKQRYMIERNEQDDLLQNLKEILIKKTLNYDIESSLDFTHFCEWSISKRGENDGEK